MSSTVVSVVDPDDVLFDDRSLVEIGGDEVARRADQLDAAIEGLLVGASPGEGREEAVVDVHDPTLETGAQRRRQDLHVTSEDDEVHLVSLRRIPRMDAKAASRLSAVTGTWWKGTSWKRTYSRVVSWFEITPRRSKPSSLVLQRWRRSVRQWSSR